MCDACDVQERTRKITVGGTPAGIAGLTCV